MVRVGGVVRRRLGLKILLIVLGVVKLLNSQPLWMKLESSITKIFYGWRIVFSGFILLFFFVGASVYSFSIFIKPLEDNFGWARAPISLTMSFYFIIGGCVGPGVGKLIHVYGERRVILASSAGTGLCYILLSLTNSLVYFYSAYALLALLSCGIGIIPVSSLVANWFNQKRGAATGFAMLGLSAGGLILAPIIGSITTYVGWRASYVFIGLLVWIFTLPVAFFLIKDKPSTIFSLDGKLIVGNKNSKPLSFERISMSSVNKKIWTLNKMLHTRSFKWLAVAFFLTYLSQMGILQHNVPIIVDMGISQSFAFNALGIIAGIGGLGKLGFGRISDTIPLQQAIILCFGLQALAVFILLFSETFAMVLVYVVLFGFAMGGVIVLMPLTVTHFFGLGGFGIILGYLWMVQALGCALGTYSAGLFYDLFDDYKLVLYFFILAYVSSIIAILLAGKPDPLCVNEGEIPQLRD